jgi:hypothetical protein
LRHAECNGDAVERIRRPLRRCGDSSKFLHGGILDNFPTECPYNQRFHRVPQSLTIYPCLLGRSIDLRMKPLALRVTYNRVNQYSCGSVVSEKFDPSSSGVQF